MSPELFFVIGVVIVGIIVWRLMIPSLGGVIAKAKEQGAIEPIVEAVEKLKPSAHPTAYNHAIRQLWDDYERPLAVELVKHLAEKHSETLIAQYWLKHVLQVEPKMAKESLPEDFLKQYYHPELAAQCGPVG